MTAASTTMPPRSLDQRHAALRRANAVRTSRARLKGELSRLDVGQVTEETVGLLFAPPDDLRTMKVSDLLLLCRGIGTTRVRAILRQARVSPSKTLGGMTPRQRRELARILHERAHHRENGHSARLER